MRIGCMLAQNSFNSLLPEALQEALSPRVPVIVAHRLRVVAQTAPVGGDVLDEVFVLLRFLVFVPVDQAVDRDRWLSVKRDGNCGGFDFGRSILHWRLRAEVRGRFWDDIGLAPVVGGVVFEDLLHGVHAA